MNRIRFLQMIFSCCFAFALTTANAGATKAAPKKPPRAGAEIIATSPASDWRDVAPTDLLVMDLPQGQVLIELAKRFAPAHAANIRTLAHEAYYDGLAIIRVQDNYVTQWGDPNGDDAKLAKSLGTAAAKVPVEFSVAYKGLPITKLKDVDGWASVTGFVDGFPVAAEPKQNKAWLTHCYGMVGAGRGEAVDSSTGAELYAIIGNAPRGLDLNITVVGRVLRGMEHLAALPRGGINMGFYEKPEQYHPITKVRLAADIAENERPRIEVLKSDSKTWADLLNAKRFRGGWFVHSFGHTDVCTTSVPVRNKP